MSDAQQNMFDRLSGLALATQPYESGEAQPATPEQATAISQMGTMLRSWLKAFPDPAVVAKLEAERKEQLLQEEQHLREKLKEIEDIKQDDPSHTADA